MMFEQKTNQEDFGRAGFVEILISILRLGTAASATEQSATFTVCANSDGSESPFDTDVAEAAACALANSLSLCPENAKRMWAAGGLEVLIRIMNSALTVNLLDVDQTLEIQTSTAYALANASACLADADRRVLVDAVECVVAPAGEPERDESPLAALVLLCASQLVSAQIAASLLLGNLACDDVFQEDLGRLGAIEALWAVARDALDATQRATALWALSNLVWANRSNQDRCHTLIEKLLQLSLERDKSTEDHQLCTDDSPYRILHTNRSNAPNSVAEQWFAARVCAVNVVANALHYNDTNRHLVEVIPQGVESLVALSHPKHPFDMREAALRCLVSISSTDRGARRLSNARTENESACSIFVVAAGDVSTGGSTSIIRQLGGAALANVSALPEAREHVCQAGGLEALVALAGSADAMERDEASSALAALANNVGNEMKRKEQRIAQLRPSAGRLGAQTLVALLKASPHSDNNNSQEDGPYFAAERAQQTATSAEWARGISADALNNADWLEAHNLEDVVALGGVDALFSTLAEYQVVSQHSKLLLSTLTAISSCAHASESVRAKAAELRGVHLLLSVARAADSRHFSEAADILHAALSALVSLAVGSAPNCKTILSVGLDFILDVAEGCSGAAKNVIAAETTPASTEEVTTDTKRRSREVAATLLRTLAPYNLIVCWNCSSSNRGGLVCVYCGHSLEKKPRE